MRELHELFYTTARGSSPCYTVGVLLLAVSFVYTRRRGGAGERS